MEGAILEAVRLSMSAEMLSGPFAFVVSKFCNYKSWTSWVEQRKSFGHSVKRSRSSRSEKSKGGNVWLKHWQKNEFSILAFSTLLTAFALL